MTREEVKCIKQRKIIENSNRKGRSEKEMERVHWSFVCVKRKAMRNKSRS